MKSIEKIRLGIFVIAGTTLFIASMYLIGDKQNLFSSNITIHAIFNDVNGLQKGNNIRYAGINIGTVKQVRIHNDSSVIVFLIITENVKEYIKKDAIVELQQKTKLKIKRISNN